MTISYKWLSEYLPVTVEPEKLSKILTSLGLEVESFEKFESVKGSFEGLVIGEVIACEKHPNAEKLSVTKVDIGKGEPLEIVCGAPNVAKGQKVVVATVGTTIHPTSGDPLTMKVAKIRGVESNGMICAEDEIGVGNNHEGIIVLGADAKTGRPASEYFDSYNDWIYEIGLTPNRMDAMSHLGVARDVCAYLTHHNRKDCKPKSSYQNNVKPDNNSLPFSVVIENQKACQRYSGVSIKGVTIKESPKWMQEKLRAIGVRPINNIVDITNFILHETGQPLHAFDADKVKGNKIIVKNLPDGTTFASLDGKERKLNKEDLMICDGDGNGLCIAGVFGGIKSGVKDETKNIFLESAWFNPVDIRKTSFRHNLRTDAALRFEKNVDISNTVNVLKRAASLIKEIAGGEIASEFIDVYPQPMEKTQVQMKFHYLRKLSGKNYHPDTVKKILTALGFEILKEGIDDVRVSVPYSKPDITLPADIVEEIMRVDGYDSIDIPQSITISPSVETDAFKYANQEKIANYLVGLGFHELLTNSITNSAYYSEEELRDSVKMLNSLSADLNMMRPSMLETGLEVIVHNLNRKNNDLRFYEFGKTYSTSGSGKYNEVEHLCLYFTGSINEASWRGKSQSSDLLYVKGVIERLAQLTGLAFVQFEKSDRPKMNPSLDILYRKKFIGSFGTVNGSTLAKFDIKQPVYYVDLDWQEILIYIKAASSSVEELPRQMPVHRDLAMVV
ncbi:MAG TPA: phenylalanine--tRNA ligase subunit beta, partial [Chitinophagaceae bacterium]|nr:phenylalanine--tRNA ligase subunit beta [Chitinophagaceae bacterium]